MNETRNVAYRAILLAAGLVVLGVLFEQLVTLMLAVLMTVIIAIPLSAGAARLERYGVPRPLGVLAGMLAGLSAVAIVLSLVIPPFVDQTERFIGDVPVIVDDLRDKVHDVTGATTDDIGNQVQDFLQGLIDDPAQLLGRITSIGLSIAAVFGALILMLITAFYMAVRPEPLLDGVRKLFPPDRRPHAQQIMERLRGSWIGWMQGVAVDMLVTGVLLYIGLTLVGLEFAVVFAVISALLVVVPYFGAIVGGALPVLFALADSPGKAALVLVIYLAVQQIESNVIIPLVMARTVRLHPAVIAVGVVLVGQVFGFVGLFVAVPILSALVILVDELWVKPTEQRHDERRHAGIELPPEAHQPPAPEEDEAAAARLG